MRWNSRAAGVIVSTMANHRELASELYAASLGRKSAQAIWRTVVFAGAMLAAPLAGCGGGKKANTTPTEQPMSAAPDPATQDKEAAAAAEREAADKAAAEQAAAAAEAEKTAADQKAKEDAEAKAKQEADAKAAEDAAAKEAAAKKKRPRGSGDARPKGRGFVLA
jgi:type IV secretory pathway VirB10-like protein